MFNVIVIFGMLICMHAVRLEKENQYGYIESEIHHG